MNVFNLISAGGGSGSGLYVWKKCLQQVISEYTLSMELIDYVISDDENAYPNGGTQGEYYYERYTPLSAGLFNCTKYITGSYTMTSTLSSIIVTHNLGVVPKVAYIWTDTVSGQTRRQAIVVSANGYTFYGEYYGTGVSYTGYDSGITATSTEFGFYSTNSFVSGATYNYIIFA